VPALSLARRELRRFTRQRSRVIGALATPVVFWLLIGLGMGRSFAPPGASPASGYITYFFPGTILMIVLFTAIFSTISMIDDRREGFLQSVLIAPIPVRSIVLGKLLGGTVLATVQATVFLSVAPLLGIRLTVVSALLTVAVIAVLGFALTGLGLCIAWPMSSTQGFHAIMNLLLMPLWFLSGALFPATGAIGPVRYAMQINPLAYGLQTLRETIYWDQPPQAGIGVSSTMAAGITVCFALAMFGLACWIAQRSAGDN